MKTKTVLILGGASVAMYMVYSHHDKKTASDDDFSRGFAAGFLTPGPFTIFALGSLAYTWS